ncbi:MAG: hypothetical protein JRG89_12500 [Deltaproteobacteria bacterium]|nr:hypothetical protein [Deltaproteobacteria bacterium]
MWVSFAVPCSSVFLPVYLDGIVPAAMARGGEQRETSGDSLWWKFQALELAAATDLERNIPWLREAWKPFEADVERARKLAESEATALRSKGDAHAASLRLSQFMEATVARAVECVDDFARECSA